MSTQAQRTLADLVFIGFNRMVVALDRYTGELVWKWKAGQGTGFPAVHIDGDRLVVALNGYVYCLEPLFGQEVWNNPLKGLGQGISCVASINGSTGLSSAAAAAAAAQQQAAAAAAAGGAV